MKNVQREAIPAQAQPKGYMRQPEVLEIVPFSAATLWRRVASGHFPKPPRLSARVTAWSRAEVQNWLDNCKTV